MTRGTRIIWLPMALGMLLSVIAVFAFGVWTAVQTDERAAQADTDVVTSITLNLQDAMAKMAVDYSLWSRAYEATKGENDMPWLVENYYIVEDKYSPQDILFVVDSALTVIHSDPGTSGITAPFLLQAGTDRLVEHVLKGNSFGTALMSTLLYRDGRLFSVSASVIRDEGGEFAPVGQRKVFVVAWEVDQQTLADAGRDVGISNLQFRGEPVPEALAGFTYDQAFTREPFYLSWGIRRPGTEFGSMLAPYFLVFVLILGGLFYFVLTRAQRLNTELATLLRISERSKDDAINASRIKSDFVATMSHEIRTPLNGIIGLFDLLKNTPLDKEQAEYVSHIEGASQSLLRIVNDILDFSKVEAGQMIIEEGETDVVALVDNVCKLVKQVAEENDLSLNAAVADEVPRVVIADGLRLRQVLLNLLYNAVKFTETGGVKVDVDVLDRPGADKRLKFSVSDTGIGIPADAQRAIFERFTQADGSSTRRFGGTGLGLSISNSIVGLMDGAIHVESKVGKGSCFWFEIPLKSVAEKNASPFGGWNRDYIA